MKLVCGVGYNDLKGTLYQDKIYQTWKDMLRRCYSDKFHKEQPTYVGCSVCLNWLTFSKFKAWMETQDWEGNQLDKDILVPGNKVYSPENCVFVDSKVNSFISDCRLSRGQYPIGVSLHKPNGKFLSQCNIEGKKINLGYFNTPEEAHKVWLEKKLSLSYKIASLQKDMRVAKAITERYEKALLSFSSRIE